MLSSVTQALFKRDANTVGALNQLEELSDNVEVVIAECGDRQMEEFTKVAEELDAKVDCICTLFYLSHIKYDLKKNNVHITFLLLPYARSGSRSYTGVTCRTF